MVIFVVLGIAAIRSFYPEANAKTLSSL